MPIVVDVKDARARRRSVEVEGYTRKAHEADKYFATLYMGAPPSTAAADLQGLGDDRSLPQAYLVEQPAAATVPAHFHDTDQFQVFVAGRAEFGKQPVAPLTVHYAAGHTPYGPIVTRDEGVHFFTLRAAWDSGGKAMPENRHLLKPVRRVHRMAQDIGAADAAPGRAEVLPCEADGLGAALFTLAAGDAAALDLPVAGAGQYALVLSGAVELDGAEYAENSCFYRFADDPPLTVAAGAGGARVLLMQFPVHGQA